MCTKLTQNGEIIIPGMNAAIKTKQGFSELKWGRAFGENELMTNARIESLEHVWKSKGYTIGTMDIDSFTEGRTKFKGQVTVGVIYRGHHFLVITEPSSPQVRKVHHRQPCFQNLEKLLAA